MKEDTLYGDQYVITLKSRRQVLLKRKRTSRDKAELEEIRLYLAELDDLIKRITKVEGEVRKLKSMIKAQGR